MRSAAVTLIFAGALLAAAGPADAIGFGRVVNVSTLGQPLNFSATVRLEADETLTRECAAAEVVSGEAQLPNAAVRVTVEPGQDPQERQIRVTTLTPVDEPVVTVNVTAGCIPRLSRSFVTLIDPPAVNLAQSTAPSLPPQRVDSQVAPVMAAAEGAAASARAPVRAPARERVAPRTQAAPIAAPGAVEAPRASRPATPPRRLAAAAPRPPGAGPRLRLDPPAAPSASASAAARPDAAAAALAAENAALAASAAQAAASAASAAEASQRRVAQLEETLVALRRSNEETQKALVELQAELKRAQTGRYANPLVYALAILSALLSVAVAVLWWRQSHPRGGTQWWLAPTGAALGGATRPPGGTNSRRMSMEVPSGSVKLETEPAVMDERPRSPVIEDMPPRVVPAPVSAPVAPPPAPVTAELPVLRRELSVEELIDLEQQADFFVVLGQDEAAIDLLMGHVRSTGGASPLPYLKLLEIYRRRGEREAYERVRERFNQRFNAYAPEWEADLQGGKSLDDYPDMLVKLQRFWDEPSRVTALLDESLMRQREGGDTFDLPAYRELLFLYSIARDLAEHPAPDTGVDLLLPLEAESRELPIEHLSASRLMGFAPTLAPLEVDVDVSRPAARADAPKSDFLGLVGERPKRGGGSSGGF